MKLVLGVSNRQNKRVLTKAELRDMFKAQDGSCAFCNMKALNWLRPVFLDDDQALLACPLCADTMELDHVGARHQHGQIVFSDIFTQIEVNLICHAAWAYKATRPEDYKNSTYEVLLSRIQQGVFEAKSRFEQGYQKVDVVSDVLSNLSDKLYAERATVLSGLLYFPREDNYAAQISYWKELVYPDYEQFLQQT